MAATSLDVDPNSRYYAQMVKLFDWPATNAFPSWMVEIVETECAEFNRPVPDLLTKYIDRKDAMQGYTLHLNENRPEFRGEICIVYGAGKFYDTWDEKHTLLHEVAHWITPPQSMVDHWLYGGHDADFYRELTRLCLKYECDLDKTVDFEYGYQGSLIFQGLVSFHLKYNGGKDEWDEPIWSTNMIKAYNKLMTDLTNLGV